MDGAVEVIQVPTAPSSEASGRLMAQGSAVSSSASLVASMEARVEAAWKVNLHLNRELEQTIRVLDQAEQDREAWEAHARQLATKLIRARKRLAALQRDVQQPGGAGADSGGEAEGEGEELNADELLQLAQMLRLEEAHARADGDVCSSAISSQHPQAPAPAADGPQGGPSFTPSDAQEQLLRGLVRRGEAWGWLIQPHEVALGEELGSGEFGVTRRGTWRGAAVAVKVVQMRQASELTTFLREVESLSFLRHPNIVPFLGACLQHPERMWLVTEYMPGGTLQSWLHPHGASAPGSLTQQRRPFLERLAMALDVAQGMCALESCSPPILHRDLKPSNVLVDAGGRARIGDFGLSRRLLPEARATLTGETGTYMYMAPEVMRHEMYDGKADVWSWGVLLAECITSTLPYAGTFLTPAQVAMGVSDETLRPSLPQGVDVDLEVLVKMACTHDPFMRPAFADVAALLQQALDKLKAKQQAPAPSLVRSLTQGLASGWGSIFKVRIYPPAAAGAAASGVLPRTASATAAAPARH